MKWRDRDRRLTHPLQVVEQKFDMMDSAVGRGRCCKNVRASARVPTHDRLRDENDPLPHAGRGCQS